MPRYLALDYAAEAIREHRSFLGLFLLTLPQSLDNYEAYAHSGSLEDYGYRLPWLQVKRRNTLQALFLDEDLAGSIKGLSSSCSRDELETFSITGDLKQDGAFSTEGEELGCDTDDELEIVPSSNPDSPPVDSQTRQRIKSSLSAYSSGKQFSDTLTESDQEHDVGKLLLEDPVSCPDRSSLIPTHEELCSQLPRKSIRDPFSDLPAERGLEELHTDKKETNSPENEECRLYSLEAWQEPTGRRKEDPLLLPELMSSSNIQDNPTFTDHLSAMNEGCKKLEMDKESSFDWSSRDFLGPNLMADSERNLFPEHFPSTTIDEPNVIELNNEGTESAEQDVKKSVGDAILEVPGTTTRPPGQGADMGEPQAKLPMTPLSCFETNIVTPRTRKRTEDQVWETEQYLHEAVALSLKVPKVNNATPSGQKDLQTLELSKDEETSAVDAVLPWKPVIIPTEAGLKYKSHLEKMEFGPEEKKTAAEMDTVESILEALEKVEGDDFNDFGDELLEPIEAEEKSETEQQRNDETKDAQENDEPVPDMNPNPKETFQRMQSSMQAVKLDENGDNTKRTLIEETNVPANPTPPIANSSRSDARRKTPAAFSSRDPLEDFLKLRRKDSLMETRITPPPLPAPPLPPPLLPAVKPQSGMQQAIAKGKEESFTDTVLKKVKVKKEELSSDAESSYEPPAAKAENKKMKSRLVVVPLSAPFLDMIRVLEEAAAPVVSYLHGNQALSTSYAFTSLTMDVTRFLLVQHEKQSSCSDTEKGSTETYRNMMLLHTYVTAADLMRHCDAVTAIMHLAAVSEKYKDILAGSLTSVRNILFKKQCLLPRGTLHPKLIEMARLAGEWLQKKLKKEGSDHDPKILVIIKRDAGKLAENIASVLSSVKGLSACSMVGTNPTTYATILESLDNHNCAVIASSQIDEAFPWAQFSLVIEYEAFSKSPWKELCLRQKIRHIELGTVGHGTSAPKMDTGDATGTDSKDKSSGGEKSPPLKLIGYEKVIKSFNLIQLLETKYNISIEERVGVSLPSQELLPTVDLLIDERTGIVVHDLEALLEEGSVDSLLHRLTQFSQQLCILWLLLEGSSKENRYSLGGHVVSNTAKLHTALDRLSAKEDDFEVKVMYCASLKSTAATIKLLCGKAKEAARKVWHAEDWAVRPWLTNKISRHEMFLSSFPCLNAFSAQVMLTAAPLTVLLATSPKQLLQLCPWIPSRILMDFYNLAHDVKSSPNSGNVREFDSSQQDLKLQREEKIEPNTRVKANKQESVTDRGAGIGYDRFDTQECNSATTGVSSNHRESMEGRNWSIMRSSSEDFPQASSMPSNENAPGVRIKEEPISPGDVYCHSSHLQEESIPDDLKTPLELIASSERSSSADNRGKVNVGIDYCAPGDSCSQIANPSRLSQNNSYAHSYSFHQQQESHRDIGDREAATSDSKSYEMLSRSQDSREPLSAECGYPHRQHPIADTRSWDGRWEQARQPADQGTGGRSHSHASEAQRMVHSDRMLSRDVREKVRPVQPMFSQQDRDPSWKKYVGIAQPCPRSRAGPTYGTGKRQDAFETGACELENRWQEGQRSTTAPDISQTLPRVGPKYTEKSQNAFDSGAGELGNRRQERQRSASALASSKTLPRAGPTYAGDMQNTFDSGSDELDHRRLQYLQQKQLYQQQQKQLQQQEQYEQHPQQQGVPHSQYDLPQHHQRIWQHQIGAEGMSGRPADMNRYRQSRQNPEEWCHNQRVPSTSAMMRDNFDQELRHSSGYDADFFADGPSKKRRLACERIPGAKDGQTRLTFTKF